MTIDVVPVAYGAAALDGLRRAVAAAKAEGPLAPVTAVVPSNAVGVAARRHLARHGGIAAVSFLTVYRLAELVAAPALAGQRRRPVSTPVLLAALRRVLAEQPGLFGPVAGHPATAEALLASHRELRDLPPDALDRLARLGGQRTRDVVRIHRAVTAALGDWYDEADLMVIAADLARRGRSPVAAAVGHVVVHLPQDLTHGQAAVLRAVAEAGSPLTVVAGLTGADDADAGVLRSLGRLGAERPGAATPPGPPGRAEVVTTSDPDEEVRLAVRRIVDAIRPGGDRPGLPLDRIAVLYPTDVPYARLLGEALDAAGIAWNGRAVRPVRDRLAGHTLLTALSLHDHDAARSEVLGLLTSGPVRDAEGRAVPTTRWEGLSRQAGIVRGRRQWDERLTSLAERAERRAAEDGGAGRPEAAGRAARQADEARRLRTTVLELLDAVPPPGRPSTWHQLAVAARALLRRLLGGERQVADWPADERAAHARVEAVLDRLGHLDDVEPGPDPARFRMALEAELDADLGRRGRLGDGILVGPLGAALGVELDLVIVVGMAEGTLPTRAGDDALLPDSERALLGDRLVTSDHRVGLQHRQLLAALAATTHAVLVAPRGDLRRSATRVPSRWLRAVAADLNGGPVDTDDLDHGLRAPWLVRVPSFASGLATVEFPATAQEHHLRSLHEHGRQPLARHPLAQPRLPLGRALTLVTARRSDAFTAFDGNVAGAAVPSPWDDEHGVAVTALEAWLSCPHAYFVERVLGIRRLDDPEEQVTIDPRTKGELAHDVLDGFLRRAMARRGGPPPAAEAWTPDDHDLLDTVLDEAAAGYERDGRTGRALYWRRDREILRGELHRLLRFDDGLRAEGGLRPTTSEHPFGLGGRPPVEVALPGGRTIRFRGKIDRVDAVDGGGCVVTDYKTGRGAGLDAVTRETPFGDGTRLQLPVYALAARPLADPGPVTARYVRIGGGRNPSVVELEVDADVERRLGERLEAVAGAIAAGVFPARPPAPGYHRFTECPVCDPDDLGTTAQYGRWLRKRAAPDLAAYVTLVPGAGDA